MRIASLLLLLWLLPLRCLASDCQETMLREESALLHRRLVLSGVRRWDRRSRAWQPVKAAAPLVVVHLWAVECVPCVAELPLLRSLTSSWRGERDVQFLFISETLNERKMLDFWSGRKLEVPDEDPCQSTDDRLRQVLETGKQPVTLLVDQQLVIRQAFIGAVAERGPELSIVMRRLLGMLREDRVANPRSGRKRASLGKR